MSRTQNSKLKTENSKFNIQNFEDFWSRQANAQTDTFECAPLGIPAKISANQPEVLAAARLSAGRFSRTADPLADRPIGIKLVVRNEPAGLPPPPDLPDRLVYTGLGDWITVSASNWGHGFASLPQREAVVVLSPELAGDCRLVSRYFIDHYLLNFMLTGWAMLHASCLASPDGERLLVLVAPHNTGKSTTALHLLRAGFSFLADGMLLFRRTESGFEVAGYPIGEVKLRDDVLAQFPEYSGQQVRVREHTKTVVDLRRLHPERVLETTLTPPKITLCFLELNRGFGSGKIKITGDDAWPLLAGNSFFWDEPARLQHNIAALESLVASAELYHVLLGLENDDRIKVFQSLV